jgi:hypothetical protein
VKIWLEEEATEAAPPLWRGHVTHVATGARRYIQSLGELVAILDPYLKDWEEIEE